MFVVASTELDENVSHVLFAGECEVNLKDLVDDENEIRLKQTTRERCE